MAGKFSDPLHVSGLNNEHFYRLTFGYCNIKHLKINHVHCHVTSNDYMYQALLFLLVLKPFFKCLRKYFKHLS